MNLYICPFQHGCFKRGKIHHALVAADDTDEARKIVVANYADLAHGPKIPDVAARWIGFPGEDQVPGILLIQAPT